MEKAVVLVVEDEALIRMNAVCMIEEAGFAVVEACNADEAIRVLESRDDIQAVFTDINMPGEMDGVGLAREISKTMPGVHVILTSGKYLSRADEIPVQTPFMTKPYTAHQLLGLLEKILV